MGVLGSRQAATRFDEEARLEPEYRLFAFIVMSFWVIAIAVAILVAAAPSVGHFGS